MKRFSMDKSNMNIISNTKKTDIFKRYIFRIFKIKVKKDYPYSSPFEASKIKSNYNEP